MYDYPHACLDCGAPDDEGEIRHRRHCPRLLDEQREQEEEARRDREDETMAAYLDVLWMTR